MAIWPCGQTPPNSWHHAELAQAFWPKFPVSRDGAPQIALPLAGDDGRRRYRLGTVTLQDPVKDKP